MGLEDIGETVNETIHNTGDVAHSASKAILKDPQIMLYPLLAAVFILLTLPTVNGLVFGLWDKLAPHSVFTVDNHLPHRLRIILGLVTFSYFYTTVVTTYFICAVSATVMHKLDGHPMAALLGLREVRHRFWRVSHFAVLAIFFAPLAIVVQWRKLLRNPVFVIGGAISMHTAQMAPAILNSRKTVTDTMRDSINTLGEFWKEGIIIKIGMWSLAILLLSIGFLPKLIEHYWFDTYTAHWVGWLVTTLLAVSFWVLTKVLGAVYVTTLYHKASNKKR